ncbi:MAG: hypothetical protein JO121_18850 [Deltaproteobacteria bacterium]|nr:hypothetical protein [Deltaproteobacteria bacterium]
MKTKFIALIPVVGFAMSLVPSLVNSVNAQTSSNTPQQSEELKDLRGAKNADWQQADDNRGTVKGPLLSRYEEKVDHLQSLIKRIKSGQQVSSDEIDEALKPVVP